MSAIWTPLSLEILEKNTCFYCKKYLSYGPVKIYPSGNISCGRCSSSEGNPGIVSLYNKVVPYLVFPCIYQSQGCSVQLLYTLNYSQVKRHEKMCPQRGFYCPSCRVTIEYNYSFLRQFSNHFKNIHDDDFLKKPQFFLNINNFDKTEKELFFSKQSMLFMLLFVKFDGQWLYINVSVPHGYGVDNFKQVVTNLGIPKCCSRLGDNSDCFKFFLPRALDCIAKIDLNVVEDTIEITISFLSNEVKAANKVPRIKSELDPPYITELFWDYDLKKVHEANTGEIDFEAHTFAQGRGKVKIQNPNILFSKCNFCEVFIWASPCRNENVYYMCAHYNWCQSCYSKPGFRKCKFDKDFCKIIYVHIKQIQFQASCCYGCGSYINYLQYKDHEKICKYNILRFMSESEVAKLCFGAAFQDNSLFVHSSIICFNFNFGENKSCYIITNGNQKCIFHYKSINGMDLFEVEHEYDKKKVAAIIQIKCVGIRGIIREEQNSFYCNYGNKNLYFQKTDSNESEYSLNFSIKIVNCKELFKKV